MTDNNDALLREVDEELRREKWEKLWKEYGTYIMSGAALIVAFVGGKQLWDSHWRAAAEAAGAKYQTALALAQDGKADESEKAFAEIAATGPTGYAMLADLNLAGALVKAGKTTEALAVFENLSKSAADPMIAGFAKLQAAALKLGEADFTEMQNRLNELTSDSSPWRISAKELLGTAAYKAGKFDDAKKIFTLLLGDKDTPREAVQRIDIVMSAIAASELGGTGAAAAAPAASEPAGTSAGTTPATTPASPPAEAK